MFSPLHTRSQTGRTAFLMAQQAIKDQGASDCENWHLSHDLAEIDATVAGHVIQLELTPKLLTTVTRQRRPANRRTAACRARNQRDPTVQRHTRLW